MKRWRGWGDSDTEYPLAESARAYLIEKVGQPVAVTDLTEEQVLAAVPATRLEPPMGITCDPLVRASHARGKSLPDRIAFYSGQIVAWPDAVALPESEDDLQSVLNYAAENKAVVIPYGGGTSVLGQINTIPGERPVLCVDMSRMDQLLDIDETSRLATFQAGVTGPALEAQLKKQGYTLGHFPDSFEYSTLGGWVATRSVGQQSQRYGRIDEMFLSGRLLTPRGWWNLPALPELVAGLDLRQMVVGSEGRLGILSQATVRVHRKPDHEKFLAVFFPHWEAGAAAVREITQAGVDVSMLYLSDKDETLLTLKLIGKERLLGLAQKGLNLAGIGDERCLLIYGLSGAEDDCQRAQWQVQSFCKKYGGLAVNFFLGEMWRKNRFLTPYMRNSTWQAGFALESIETCLPWSLLLPAVSAIKNTIQTALQPDGEQVLVFAHLSHLSDVGASTSITCLWRRSVDPAQTLAHWQTIIAAAKSKIVEMGGMENYPHGVGFDHPPTLEAGKGAVGKQLLTDVFRSVDPDGMMNPGKLVGYVLPPGIY